MYAPPPLATVMVTIRHVPPVGQPPGVLLFTVNVGVLSNPVPAKQVLVPVLLPGLEPVLVPVRGRGIRGRLPAPALALVPKTSTRTSTCTSPDNSDGHQHQSRPRAPAPARLLSLAYLCHPLRIASARRACACTW